MENKNNITKQINREAVATIILYLIYFIWWYYFAYIYSSPEEVENYKYILGLPEWFFYSCVLGFILINFLVFLVTKFFFKNIDFKPFEKNEEDK